MFILILVHLLPNNVRYTVGYSLFDYCYSLFDNCYSLFDNCYSLLPNNVRYAVGYSLFDNCYSLFDNCYSITSVSKFNALSHSSFALTLPRSRIVTSEPLRL